MALLFLRLGPAVIAHQIVANLTSLVMVPLGRYCSSVLIAQSLGVDGCSLVKSAKRTSGSSPFLLLSPPLPVSDLFRRSDYSGSIPASRPFMICRSSPCFSCLPRLPLTPAVCEQFPDCEYASRYPLQCLFTRILRGVDLVLGNFSPSAANGPADPRCLRLWELPRRSVPHRYRTFVMVISGGLPFSKDEKHSNAEVAVPSKPLAANRSCRP